MVILDKSPIPNFSLIHLRLATVFFLNHQAKTCFSSAPFALGNVPYIAGVEVPIGPWHFYRPENAFLWSKKRG
jgi:hypothetical protein